ncbi:hypothetical protein AAIH46_01020 [Rhizobium sp. 0TCS1.26]|uniref:hypothetical protein n=1 Tax=Rhizobium sp. 0TCS1.26 TaxID=3142623 RepID=UPI003D2AA7D5
MSFSPVPSTGMDAEDGVFAETLKNLAVAFLVGPDAGYITGATLTVDGSPPGSCP